MSASTPRLSLQSVDASYGAVQILFGLTLEVGAEIVTLLGGNASGKSTTMKVVMGLLRPVRGEVRWEGASITALDTPDRIRLGLAAVPESRRIFGEMSVRENMIMGAYARNDRRAVLADLERTLELFPRLADRLGQQGGTLSGGEQQMLALARALMSRPKMICMDEPTMGLAPAWVDRVLDLIVRLNRTGISFFMVEQSAHLALSIAHRGYVLQNGHIVLHGAAAGLLGDPRIRDAYLGETQMVAV